MPELPDVETFRRYLDATALHQTVTAVAASDKRLVAGEDPAGLAAYLRGHRFERSYRHGKYLFAALESEGWLEWHFGMSGHFVYSRKGGQQAPKEAHVRFQFDNGDELFFLDQRKLGHVAAVPDLQARLAGLELGIDALHPGLDAAAFRALAEGRRGQVKCWLMDQSTLAGLGNVYSDEILFHAGLYPRRPLETLDTEELECLYGHLRRVLRVAIEAQIDPERMPEDFLVPLRGLEAPSCPRCGGPLNQVKACGRTALFCPSCQPPEPD